MSGLLTRRVQVAAEIENVSGTAMTLTAIDAKILAYEPVFNFNPTQFKRDPYRKTLSRMNSEPGLQICELTFKCEVMGPAIAAQGEACAYGNFMRACANSEALVVNTSSTYAPQSSGMNTITIAVYEDGLRKTLCGAMGNVKITCNVGEPIMAEFTFMGKYSEHSDASMLSPSYPASKPLIFQNATVTVFSDVLLINTLEIDYQNEVIMQTDPTDPTGYKHAKITARNPQLTFDPEQELVATHDFLSKLLSTTEAAVSIIVSATDGTQLTISLPKVRYTGLSGGDRNGIRTYSATCEINMSSGDDEITQAFAGTTTSTTTTSTTTTSTTSTSTTLA